jgi:nitrite reductase/ring-hydroxylating ferredoxin subunit
MTTVERPVRKLDVASSVADYSELVLDDRVHSRVYNDEAIFDDELTKIWHRGWVFVGHDSEVANRGDYVARRIGRQPVVMTRDMDGVVHVHLNRCPHRGNVVCLDEAGNTESFRCAYHGWNFGVDGKLRSLPYRAGYGADFAMSDFGMTPVPRLGIHRGFVYASLSDTGIDLRTHLGHTWDYLNDFADLAPAGELDLSVGCLKTRVHGNWKMVFENVCDGYHPPHLHRSVFAAAVRKGLSIGDAYGDESQITTRDLGDGHIMLDFRETNRQTGGPVIDLGGAVSAEAVEEYRLGVVDRLGEEHANQLINDGTSNVGIFPNLGMLFQDVRVIEPVSVNETNIYNFPALLKGAPKEVNRARMYQEMRLYGPGGSVGPDDHEIYERNQLGFEARINEWVMLRRGIEREHVDGDGVVVGNASDETTMRGFWRHYRSVMSGD